jgi:hypothetical protein
MSILCSLSATHIHGATSPIYELVVPLGRIAWATSDRSSTLHYRPAFHPTPVESAH